MIGVDLERFHTARLVEEAVTAMVDASDHRRQRIADRMGISLDDLKNLRRAFAGDVVDSVVRTRAVIRKVAALGHPQSSRPPLE